MSGISMVLNTAKQALSVSQTGLNVTGHNISNVNTEAFSRQTPIPVTQPPMVIGGLNMGTGVKVDDIVRSSDELLEKRLTTQQSLLSASKETESYIDVLETLFDETSEDGLSREISTLWNSWQDLANNPTGSAERTAVYDTGNRLAELFNARSSDIQNLTTNLNKELNSAVSQINTLTKQIAKINLDIVANFAHGEPNDQMDTRNDLVRKLSELVDIKTFTQSNGSLTIITGSGHTLVTQGETFDLTMSGNTILWEGSNGSHVDITNNIIGGKMGGWLQMRDEVLPKYSHDLDALAKEFAWSVNFQHSQGVGLNYFDTPVTGTYATDDSLMLSTLPSGDRIDYTADFRMWVRDSNTSPPTAANITVDMGMSSAVPTYGVASTTFTTASTAYTITATGAGTVGTDAISFTWQNAAGGSGVGAMNAGDTFLTLNDGSRLDLGAGSIVAGNTLKVNVDAVGKADPLAVGVTGTANSLRDTYKFAVKSGGAVGGPIELEWSNSITAGTISLDAETTTVEVDGMTLNFASGTLAAGEEFTITTDASRGARFQPASDWHWTLASFRDQFNAQADLMAGGGPGSGYVSASITADNTLTLTPISSDYTYAFSGDGSDGFVDSGLTAALGINTFFTGYTAANIRINATLSDSDLVAAAKINGLTGDYGVGDNQNAIAIADIQYQQRDIVQWTFNRGTDDTSSILSATMEGFFQGMIGSMGIKAASIRRDSEFNTILANKIGQQRDSISGVNLDEEMVNLMKFQHAFAVASKLLTVADEMLQTLINTR